MATKNRAWLTKSSNIAIKVISEYKRQGLTTEELADRMEVSQEKLRFILKGGENLTLKTICKMEEVLKIQLI